MDRLHLKLLLIVLTPLSLQAQNWGLEQCLDYARSHNKEILAATKSTQMAVMDRKTARSALAPEVNAVAGLDYYWQIPVQILPGEVLGKPGEFIPVRMGTPWTGNAGVEARLSLIDAGKWAAIRYSVLLEQSEQSNVEFLQKTLERNVMRAFYEAQTRKRSWQIMQQWLNEYRETHQLIRERFDRGIIGQIEINQSKAILNERENLTENAYIQFQNALIDLKFWMNFGFDDELVVKEEELPGVEVELSVDFQAERLPDYTYQKQKVELAQLKYKRESSAFYPKLDLSVSYRYLGFGQQINFITENNSWFPIGFIGAKLEVPLFSLGKMVFQPQKLKTEIEIATLRFEQYKMEQNQHFLQEKNALLQARKSLFYCEENYRLAEQNEVLSRQKTAAGITDMVQLKQVQQDLTQSLQKWTDAQREYLNHYAEIFYLQHKAN